MRMVQFQLSITMIAIVDTIVGDNKEEFDLIYAFREKPSQTMDQLIESSGFATKSLAQKGKIVETANIERRSGLLKRLFRQSLNISLLGVP